MTARAIWGDRGDGQGVAFYVPKSGFDAFSATGEQSLIDQTTYIYQPLQCGIMDLPWQGTSGSQGAIPRFGSTPVNSFIGTQTRVFVWINLWVTFPADGPTTPGSFLFANNILVITSISGGLLTIQAQNVPGGYFSGTNPQNQVFHSYTCTCAWAAFRALY